MTKSHQLAIVVRSTWLMVLYCLICDMISWDKTIIIKVFNYQKKGKSHVY